MSREISLEDLASGGGGAEAAEAAEAAAGDGGEWALELYEKLQDDGMLQAILFGPDALPPDQRPDGEAPALEGGSGQGQSPAVDAETVADALEDVQTKVGDLRISQLVKLTRDNPALVDQLLEEHLQADDSDPAETADMGASDGD